MKTTISARCGCGAVQFKSEDAPLLQLICHCSDCREASKNDFTTTVFFLASSTRTSGDLAVREFTTATGGRTCRESCSSCGSLLFDKSDRFPTLIGVMTQTIEPPFEAEPSCHVWVKSKLSHVAISDELPQHSEDLA